MLEFRTPCPHCNASCGGIALNPWHWFYRRFGLTCWRCGQTFRLP